MRTPAVTDGLALAAIAIGLIGGLVAKHHSPWTDDGLREYDVVIQVERSGVGSDGVAVYASTLEQEGMLLGDYGGRLHREGSDLRAELRGVTLRLDASDAAGQPAMISSIRLALVEATADGWTEVRGGERQPVAIPFEMGSVHLDELSLSISDLDDDELVGRWIAIVHEVTRPGVGTTEVALHADESILDRLMGWHMGGC